MWQVTHTQENVYDVDLYKRTHGCKKWDLTILPCHHDISIIYRSKQYLKDFVHDFYKKPLYFEAYNTPIYHVPREHLWTKTDTSDIDPRVFKIENGRVQTKRRKGKYEVPQPKMISRMASITCSNFKLFDHRYTDRQVPLKLSLQMRKKQHQVLLICNSYAFIMN